MTDRSEERLRTALGFAMKAGRVRSGELAAEKAVKGGRAFVAVVDTEASALTKKHWQEICERASIPLIFAEDVGPAIGREAHMVACVTDSGFARMILGCRNENEQ
ncbi:MAG: ribosomal L7Ae/L30e/S12e/Gadd45 family protein [Clostridia bacterium]|nr:ribosomal L7Ae/L30e/S12e/Gadd45 family protein [Clostridia bacterium]